MIGPFARVPAVHRRNVQYAATGATVALLAAIVALGAPLHTGAAPLGLVSLQFAASPDVAVEMLASWADVARARVLWTHVLDLVLPFAYALAIGTAAARAAARSLVGGGSAPVAQGAVLVAAIADQVENLAMGVTLLGGSSWGSVLVTLAAATVKFATLALALAALGVTVQAARGGVAVARGAGEGIDV